MRQNNPPPYHDAELQIARTPGDPRHSLPPMPPEGARVLDVGCGAGQTLIALCPNRITFGVDVDFAAIQQGRRWTDFVLFACAAAEALPYRDASVDFAVSRVALPFTDLRRSIPEIYRVLRPGGSLWLELHTAAIPLRQARRTGASKGWIYFAYVVLNSAVFHCFQQMFPFRGKRYESFQTPGAIRRALRRAGFTEISLQRGEHFIVTAKRV